ncbi:hypothetical protein SUGI_0589910 [Cryptomeria japonica]|nr:hypothetical protein SUGI_0589910 [Cryptomeria japonica]
MVAIEGNKRDNGCRSRDTDVRCLGVQSTKIGSWSDEEDITFPIEAGRLQPTQKPANSRRANMFHRDRYSKPQMNYGNPYSSGNQCPIDPHKWKENVSFGITKVGKITLGQTMPGFGDLTFILKIGTLGRIEGETLIFEDRPFSLIIPIILNLAQWGKDININILPNDFYMIEFMSNEEKWQAKNKDPYILDGIEVHIIEWQPNFNPRTHVLLESKVWIRFYNCPLDYWHIDVFKDICKYLGTFVSFDDILEEKIWRSFLRICISIDQITKIPDEVKIIGARKFWIQKIDREDQLYIFPKCFSLDHTSLGCDVSAMIQKSYSRMQFPIEESLQSEPPTSTNTGEDFCNKIHDNENISLTKATPLNIAPPFDQSESQQDILMLLEKTKTLQADIETKLADSLPSSPLEIGSQLVIEDCKIHP